MTVTITTGILGVFCHPYSLNPTLTNILSDLTALWSVEPSVYRYLRSMHLRPITPSVYASLAYRTFGLCTFGLSHLWSMHLRPITPSVYASLAYRTFGLCTFGLSHLWSMHLRLSHLRSIHLQPIAPLVYAPLVYMEVPPINGPVHANKARNVSINVNDYKIILCN